MNVFCVLCHYLGLSCELVGQKSDLCASQVVLHTILLSHADTLLLCSPPRKKLRELGAHYEVKIHTLDHMYHYYVEIILFR